MTSSVESPMEPVAPSRETRLRAPTLVASPTALPPEGELFAPWGGPAALITSTVPARATPPPASRRATRRCDRERLHDPAAPCRCPSLPHDASAAIREDRLRWRAAPVPAPG